MVLYLRRKLFYMDRQKFEEKFKERDNYEYLDNESINAILEMVTECTEDLSTTASGSEDRQLLIAMEELAELSQEVSKYLRGKGDYMGLLEELADVTIVMKHIKMILGIKDEDLNRAVCIKIDESLDKIGPSTDRTPIR